MGYQAQKTNRSRALGFLRNYSLYNSDDVHNMPAVHLPKKRSVGTLSAPNLPQIRTRPDKVTLESQRTVRLAVHRVVSPPPIYTRLHPHTAMECDLGPIEHKPHFDPKLAAKRFENQRAAYQSFPANLPNCRPAACPLCTDGTPVGRSRSGGAKLQRKIAKGATLGESIDTQRSRSTQTFLPACGPQTMRGATSKTRTGGSLKPSKSKIVPLGYEVLKKLHDGALPSVLCPPI